MKDGKVLNLSHASETSLTENWKAISSTCVTCFFEVFKTVIFAEDLQPPSLQNYEGSCVCTCIGQELKWVDRVLLFCLMVDI